MEFLRKAIEQHQSMLAETDLDPTPIDFALWASLKGEWTFDKIDLAAI